MKKMLLLEPGSDVPVLREKRQQSSTKLPSYSSACTTSTSTEEPSKKCTSSSIVTKATTKPLPVASIRMPPQSQSLPRQRSFVPRTTYYASSNNSLRLRSNFLHKLGINGTNNSNLLPHHQDQQLSLSAPRNQEPSRGSLLGNVRVERIPLKDTSSSTTILEGRANKRQRQKQTQTGYRVGGPTPADTMVQALGSLWASANSRRSSSAQHHQEQQQSNDDQEMTTVETNNNDGNNNASRHVRFQPEVSVIPIPMRHEYSNRIKGFLWEPIASMQASILRNTLEFTADGWNWEDALDEDEHYMDPSTGELIHPVHLEIAQMPQEDREAILPHNYTSPINVTALPHPWLHPCKEEDSDEDEDTVENENDATLVE